MFGTKTKKSGKQAPISAHPFFAAVVALWFAALIGLGSLVLPVALFEELVTITGISSLISAAQPPLGTTARIAIAVFAAIAGAVSGLLIARKVAAAQTNAEPGRNVFGQARGSEESDASTKKPILAHEELGSESLDEPIGDEATSDKSYSGKRRSLAVTDDSGPSDYFEHAPLPGGDAMVDQFVEDTPAAIEPEAEFMDDADPGQQFDALLELAEVVDEEAGEEEFNLELSEDSAPRGQEELATSAVRLFDAPFETHTQDTTPQAAVDPVADLHEELGTMADQENSPVESGYIPLGAEPPLAESVNNPFAEPVVPHPGMQAPPTDVVSQSAGEQPASSGSLFAAPAEPVEPAFAPAITDKSLGDLGMVELVERFALALQAKADAKAQELAEAEDEAERAPLVFQRSSATSGEAAAAPFAPSEAEEAGNALAQFFAEPAVTPVSSTQAVPLTAPAPDAMPEPARTPELSQPLVEATAQPAAPAIPTAMQPVGLDESDDDMDDAPALSLSLNKAHQPFSQPPVSAESADRMQSLADSSIVEDEEENDSAEYSSLLAMKSPFASGQEFVRVEDDQDAPGDAVEPTVVFPGSERRATPAVDGPSRDPFPEASAGDAPALRPFDAPGQARPSGQRVHSNPAGSDDTERALRDALEKLQRMSSNG